MFDIFFRNVLSFEVIAFGAKTVWFDFARD